MEKPRDLGPPLVDNPENLTKLHPDYPVWIDKENKQVILIGSVCRADYPLEFFATYPDQELRIGGGDLYQTQYRSRRTVGLGRETRQAGAIRSEVYSSLGRRKSKLTLPGKIRMANVKKPGHRSGFVISKPKNNSMLIGSSQAACSGKTNRRAKNLIWPIAAILSAS